MATNELTETHMIAARKFTDSLSTIGFDMDAVFWAYDEEDERYVLIVVTDVFDAKGPLEIYQQIFKAYNASLTPKEIDPFSVRVLSTNQTTVKDLIDKVLRDRKRAHYKKDNLVVSQFNFITEDDYIEEDDYISDKTAFFMMPDMARRAFSKRAKPDDNVPELTIRREWVVMVKPRHKIRENNEIIRKWELFKINLAKLTA